MIIQDYILDGDGGIENPLEMTGKVLQAKMLVLCGQKKRLANFTKAAQKARLDVKGYVVSSYVVHMPLLTRKDQEKSVLLIDIGAEATCVSCYEKGKLVFLETFLWGGKDVTDAIASGLRLSLKEAEDLKKVEGSCERGRYASDERLYTNRSALAPLNKERLTDLILPQVNICIANLTKILSLHNVKLVQEVVFVGGGARLDGLKSGFYNRCVSHYQKAYLCGRNLFWIFLRYRAWSFSFVNAMSI